MPPKADIASEGTVSIENFRYVLQVIESAGQITPVWADVAVKNGIGYPKNAAGKFRDLMKKHGYKFDSNTLTPIGVDTVAAPKPPKTPKAKAAPKTPKSKTNAAPASKKRKVAQAAAEDDEDEEGDGNGAKKGENGSDGEASTNGNVRKEDQDDAGRKGEDAEDKDVEVDGEETA